MADPKIKYDIEANATGGASVGDLETKLQTLAKTLDGELKTKALGAAAALAQVSSKSAAVDTFKALLAETRSLGNAMEAAAKTVDKLGSELPQASAATKALAEAQAKAAKEFSGTKAILDEQRTALVSLRADYKSGAVSATDYKEASAQLKVTIKDLRDQLAAQKTAQNASSDAAKEAARAEKTLTSEYNAALTAAKGISAELGRKRQALDETRSSLKAAGIDTANLSAAERTLAAQLVSVKAEATSTAAAIQKNIGVASTEMSKFKGSTDGVSEAFGSLKTKIVAAASLVAGYFGVGLFTGAVKGAADLEAGMSRVQAASGATAKEMEALKKAAVDAGASTKFTATEAAGALEELVKAGLSAKDAIGTLPAVLNLAQAGGVGLAESSSTLTQVVAGLGLKFSDTARIADVLAMGANASKSSINGLSQALSYAAPVANAAKLSLEETVAILGKFADGSIDASRAGTALNSILSQFIDPASKFRQELAGAGIVTDNFSVAIRQLAAAGPKGSQAILAVGTEAGPALRALLNQGIGALDELKGKLDQSGGSAAKAAAIMEDNLKGAFNSLASAWDTVKIALGEPVLPVLTSAAKDLTKGISEAVSNGTIGRFGEAIATAFQSAITWIKSFVAEADLTQTTAKLQEFAQRMGENLQKAGEYASNASNVVKLAYGVMSAGTNVVLAAVYAVSGAFAVLLQNVQGGIALILTGLSKITFGDVALRFKEAAADMQLSAQATGAASAALASKAKEALFSTADSAQIARTAFAELTKEADKSTLAHTAGAAAIGTVAVKLQEMAEANAKASATSAKQKDEIEKTTVAVGKLKVEYEAAIAAGDIQLAAQKQQQLRDELAKTQAKAVLTKDALQSAFESLGITSQAKLKESADAAQRLFDTLKTSGQATALDLQNAFEVLAKRTLDAAGPVGSVARAAAQSTLDAKAAVQGLNIEFDAAGKTIVRAMGQGSTAVNGITSSINMSADALKAQEEAFDRIAMKYKLRADYTER